MRKDYLKPFFTAFCYGICFYLLQFLLHSMHIVPNVPDATKLLYWDAQWYQSIVKNGYQYSEAGFSNSGFFILFPLLWKMLHLNPWTVSLLNIGLFASAFSIFSSMYKLTGTNRLVWLTFPSIYVAFIPYTESLFLLLVTIAMWGIVRHKHYVVWVSIFLLSLTRPVAAILVPAFFITELITNPPKDWLLSIRNALLVYILPLLIGLALFIWYQYRATGVWFAYFKQQEMHWGHSFALPTLPFNSMFGLRMLWLNAAALCLGFIALLLLIRLGWQWILKSAVSKDKLFILSCLYFVGISLVTILFNPTWVVNSTNIYDLHRYAFVTPFFWVLLHRFTITNTYKPIDYLKVLLLVNIFWLTCHHYQHIQKFLYFNGVSVIILLYLLQTHKNMKWLPWVIIAFNLTVQVYIFQCFIGDNIYPG